MLQLKTNAFQNLLIVIAEMDVIKDDVSLLYLECLGRRFIDDAGWISMISK